jgi:ribonuclease BN (tRNA processing enzyme)
MKLVFCGTAAGMPTATRACAGIALQHGGSTLMLDCGPCAMREALRAGIEPGAIDAVVLSHLHYDHTLDLGLFGHFSRSGRIRLPVIYGPPGTNDVVAGAGAFFDAVRSRRPATMPGSIEIEAGQGAIAGFEVLSVETPHASDVRAFARRFTAGGVSVVYTGDTRANPEGLVPLADGASVLIHEAYSRTMIDRSPPDLRERLAGDFAASHCEVREAAAIARDAGAGLLVLTHILPYEDPDEMAALARGVFKGEVMVASDGLVLELAL